MNYPDDDEILTLIFQHNKRDYGFNLLLRKYQKRVYWLTRKMVIDHDDADDITQNVFIKIWLNIDKFRLESQLFTWIYRITVNEILQFLNKKRRRFFVPFVDVEKELINKLHTDQWFDSDEATKKFYEAILKLPQKQRLVFNMRYFENMKYEEMSKILNISVGALKASYHHAVEKIEKYVNEN